MFRVVINGVGGRHEFLPRALCLSSIQIPVEAGKIATGNFQPQNMPFEKHVAGRPQVNCELVNLTRVHQCRLFLGVAITGPDNSFRQVLRETIWCNVDKFGG